MERSSPMMEQYKKIKQQHPDKLVMFQVGDFYELFYDDAVLGARELEIALTSRGVEKQEPIPLAGVPIHAAENYISRLLNKGYRVVICDQVEEASLAKGLVRREVTRILTPGTITDSDMLEESRNNYLAVIVNQQEECYGLAVIDVSTGEFQITEQRGSGALEWIADEIKRIQASECLCSSKQVADCIRDKLGSFSADCFDLLHFMPDVNEIRQMITEQWGENLWHTLKLDLYPHAAAAGAAALGYLQLLQHPKGIKHFHQLDLYFVNRNLIIDNITNRNLELTQSYRDASKQGSLLGLLDHCNTAMGRRTLRRWVEQPLLDPDTINARLDSVAALKENPFQRQELRSILSKILDIERFCSRLTYRRINPRDLASLKNTLKLLKPLCKLLAIFNVELLKNISNSLPAFDQLIELLEQTLVNEPPILLKEGGIFRSGFNSEVDRLKALAGRGNEWLLEHEKQERERTGIRSLRIGYNRNFGYYMEVTRANLESVPAEYERKQTLINAERFTTPQLQEMEQQIISAREKLARLEFTLFEQLREDVIDYTSELLQTAHRLALLDCLQSLAQVAEVNNYCRPEITPRNELLISQGRHPVVENNVPDRFVANDINIDRHNNILIITGPNMAGKSTYIRSVALISIMAQMGSFVPAAKAELPLIDRIFARIGASDDLSSGHSTFMVEMQETAVILNEATNNSLIILDEIGRGTSTYDGMSIARSVLEYICNNIRAKTLFSTHYHELTNLEKELPGIKNYTMAVRERGKAVIFLRQVVPGSSDKSYGINVARLAGIPLEVLIRAEAILAEMEKASKTVREQQLSLLPLVSIPSTNYEQENKIIRQLRELDLNQMTPLEALQNIYYIQQKLFEIDKEAENEGDN